MCRKIRIFPNQQTRQKLRSWFGCVRKTYNLALNAIKEKEIGINLVDLRKEFTNNSKIEEDGLYPYLLETPSHIRAGGISDLVEAYRSNFAKRKINPHFQFDIQYRSKKLEQSILIESDSCATIDTVNHILKMYPSCLGSEGIKYHVRHNHKTKEIVPSIDYDCRLILDTMGRFYLNIPCHVETCDNQTRSNDIDNSWASLDPGVRTFQTIYSPTTGCAYKIGQGSISRIYRLCLCIDKLISKRDKGFQEKNREKGQPDRQKNQRKIKKLRIRIRHLIDEVHWKTINFLLTNFSAIMIPIFEVQSMVSRMERKISKNSVRQLISWRHYEFRQRLISSASRTNVHIHVIGEEYSTQACGNCQNLDKNVGGKEIYKCRHCGIKLDRDLNGSRNIFIMNSSMRQIESVKHLTDIDLMII
jgi:putative transposase